MPGERGKKPFLCKKETGLQGEKRGRHHSAKKNFFSSFLKNKRRETTPQLIIITLYIRARKGTCFSSFEQAGELLFFLIRDLSNLQVEGGGREFPSP